MSTRFRVGKGATVIGARGQKLQVGEEVVLDDRRATQLVNLNRSMLGIDMATTVRVANGTIFQQGGKQHPPGTEVVLDDALAERLVHLGSMDRIPPKNDTPKQH